MRRAEGGGLWAGAEWRPRPMSLSMRLVMRRETRPPCCLADASLILPLLLLWEMEDLVVVVVGGWAARSKATGGGRKEPSLEAALGPACQSILEKTCEMKQAEWVVVESMAAKESHVEALGREGIESSEGT